VILSNDRDDGFRFRGEFPGICSDSQTARSECLVSAGIAVPTHDIETMLTQAVGHRSTHSTESNQPNFHMRSSLLQRTVVLHAAHRVMQPYEI